MTRTAPSHRAVLLTGFPSFLARALARQLVRDGLQGQLWLLSAPKLTAAARKVVATLPRSRGLSVHLLTGDVLDLHLGLTGPVFRKLAAQVTEVFHLAEVSHPSAPAALLRRVNVEGTRNLLDVAQELTSLIRLHHLSTAFVSGDRDGVVAEDELEAGQKTIEPYAASKLEAERLIAAARGQFSINCYRPSYVVGDSTTGETDRLEGPLYLALRLAASALPALPIPGGAEQPLHVVPVDHVARAIAALSRQPQAAGGTFHLVDPNPLSVRRTYEVLAALAHKRLEALPVPRGMAEVVLRLWRPQQRWQGHAGQLVFYTQERAAALLGPALRCPPLRDYLPVLLKTTRAMLDLRREASAIDALDGDVRMT